MDVCLWEEGVLTYYLMDTHTYTHAHGVSALAWNVALWESHLGGTGGRR